MKKYKIVNPQRFISAILVMILIIASVVVVIANPKPKFEIVGYDTVYIHSGDTLWAIAEDINNTIDSSLDPREIIDDIIDMNEWDGCPVIHPGDVVSVPVYQLINK